MNIFLYRGVSRVGRFANDNCGRAARFPQVPGQLATVANSQKGAMLDFGLIVRECRVLNPKSKIQNPRGELAIFEIPREKAARCAGALPLARRSG